MKSILKIIELNKVKLIKKFYIWKQEKYFFSYIWDDRESIK